jgi:hypothetical protein
MNPIIAALIFSLVIPLYLIRLMADGRKLRNRLCRTALACAAELREEEGLFLASDYAMWTAHPSRKVEAADGGGNGRSYAPDVELHSAE